MLRNLKSQPTRPKSIAPLFSLLILLCLLVSLAGPTAASAQAFEPPEEPRFSAPATGAEQVGTEGQIGINAATTPTNSAGIAWADPNGPHSVYSWFMTFNQMGHLMESYQNYGSDYTGSYFHHGIDVITNNYGVNVYAVSGGQVVNVQNYQPGNSLYWEVAILDPEGYVWQYHHINQSSIPAAINNAFNAWKADPVNGGFISAGALIGTNVQWPTYTFGYYFHHIHLNILADNDVYINPLEFFTPINDTQAPEIQAIGLLKSNTVTAGTAVSGDYGLYVRARDLYLSSVYYLPPYKYEFSMDGGPWTTVWEFHSFPGGSNDYTFVNDFYVYPPTCGNYSCRDFYVDLGFTTSGQRAFPTTPGQHTIQVRVWDFKGLSATSSFTYTYYKTYENTTATSITDNSCTAGTGVSKTFNVTDDIVISDVNVGLNLTHATRGQLQVTLKAPGDATATTIVNTSSDAYDNYDVLVDDASTSAINDGSNDTVASPYYDRTAGPSVNASLDAFNGKSALGTWTLYVCDNTSSTTGTVNRVKLDIAGTANTNHAPVANPQSVSTNEDTPVAITLTGSDADSDPLTYSVTANPAHGALSGTAPNLTYTPAANYNGADSFTFKVNDGTVDSAVATVSLTVNAVNDAPVANAQAVTTNEDTAKAITLSGSDVDGNPLTYTVLNAPLHGTLSGTAPALTYTPAANYNGADSFTFKANDGLVDSAPATVSITVSPVNDAPVADPQSLATDEDTALAITLSGSDIDSGGLTFAVTAQPIHGVLSGAAPNLTYTPAADFHGSDSFQFVANDGAVNSAPATVDLTVASVNDAPFADAQSVVTQQEIPVAITLTGADIDGDVLTFEVLTGPAHGALSGTAPDLTYTPETGFTGDDSFTFAANDGLVDSAPATVSLTVTRTNHQPVADSQAVTTAEDVALAITLSGADPDSDPLTFNVVNAPAHGLLSGVAPDLTYTPDGNFNGADSFTFVANDGLVDSASATVDITVTAVNDAPAANAQAVSVAEDAAVAITLSGADVDGDALTYTVVDLPVHGALSGIAPDLTYTPAADTFGADSFTFKVNDGAVDSDLATVAITVTPINDVPVADAQAVTTAEDTAVAITLSGSDVEGSALTYSVVSAPAHGSLSGSAPNLTYTPAANYNGADSFTFKVNDGAADSAPALVSISVTAVNDAPVANAQAATTNQDTAVAITLSGSDVDGDALTYVVTGGPANGALSGTAPGLTYTPNSGYSGSDSFTFVVNDGQVDSAPATVSITVNPGGPLLYLGSSTSGTAGGVSFADEDILIKNQSTGVWTMYFDGSDVGLANTDVDAFELQTDGTLLVSFDSDFTLTNFGAVDDSDILRFVPTELGATTAGSWQWYFDGSDVGLTTSYEDVDAFDVLADGRLIISTLDTVSVTGASGADEDLLVFTPTALGSTTSGTWAMYFDGSDVGLSSTSNEDVNGVWVDAAGKIYLTTLGNFSVTGVSGDGSDLFVCTPGSLGGTTTCTYAMYWDGSVQGFSGEDTDSVSIVP